MRQISYIYICVVVIILQLEFGCCNNCAHNVCGNKNYYLAVYTKANFREAISMCRAHGMELASILCKEEEDLIIKHLKESDLHDELVWTSGNDLLQEGLYNWFSTGKPFEYYHWAPEQPKKLAGSGKNCIDIRTVDNVTGMGVSACSNQYYYLCEDICCT